MAAKLYIYPYRIAERKEAFDKIARNFKSKSVFSVEIKEKTLVLGLIEEPIS